MDSPGTAVVKNPPANAGDTGDKGLILGLERSPGEGHGNSLQYSCLGNPMDRGAWWAAVHGVAKGSDTTKQLNNNNENQGALGESTWLSVGIYSTVHSGVLVFLWDVSHWLLADQHRTLPPYHELPIFKASLRPQGPPESHLYGGKFYYMVQLWSWETAVFSGTRPICWAGLCHTALRLLISWW